MRPLASVAILGASLALAAPALARADTVTDWNDIASTAIVGTANQPPPVSVLSFAMTQGAVYDAVNAIDRRHRSYLVEPRARRTDSEDAAAATAAFRVLVALFPEQQATLQARYDASMASIVDTPAGAKAAGTEVGAQAAAAMLAARAGDGRGGTFTPVIGTAPGAWRPTPPTPPATDPAPWVANVRPIVVPSAEMLRSAGPNPLSSRAYARDFNEVKSVGALHSTTRTADETDAAIFWQDHAFALWNRVLRGLAADRGLSIGDSARMLAATNLAAADAAIGCWNDKYHWSFWRPITAIREADTDGNPATTADSSWLPLFDPATPVASGPPLVTPPFPDHPSGHTCATGAIVRTLQYFFGTDRVPFIVRSNRSGTTRRFARLSNALREVIDARVWAGIHFRTAGVQGAKLGEEVARYLHRHYLQPVGHPCAPRYRARNAALRG
jgi:hypothetical protein